MIVQAMPYPAAAGGASDDPFAANVVLLTDYGDTNGGTSFTDLAGNHTLTPVNGAQSDTSVLIGGRPSLLLNGTNQRVDVSLSSHLDLGRDPFTVEMLFKASVVRRQALYSCYDGTAAYRGEMNSSNYTAWGNDTAGTLRTQSGGTPSTNVTHFAWVRQNNVERSGGIFEDFWRLYIDGVQFGTNFVTSSSNIVLRPPTQPMRLGYGYSGFPIWFAGNLGPLRITKGVCRYPDGTAFTPPTSFPAP